MMRSLILSLSLATSVFAVSPTLAEELADGAQITSTDWNRLNDLDRAYGAALREAFDDADPAELDQVLATLSGEVLTVEGFDPKAMAGEWRCRTTKIGKTVPAVTYQPFKCRISVGADGKAVLEKISGSQLTRGTLHTDGDRIVYLGAGYINGDPPPDYASLPPEFDVTASPQQVAEVGVLELLGPDRARLLFPYPHLESTMDVLLLTR